MIIHLFSLLNLLDCGIPFSKSSVCITCVWFHGWHLYNCLFCIAQCFTYHSCLTISEESILAIRPPLLSPLPIVLFSFVLLKGGCYCFFLICQVDNMKVDYYKYCLKSHNWLMSMKKTIFLTSNNMGGYDPCNIYLWPEQ